ncbi:MAG: hypothetical protein MJD61_09405 [Proteobacteria bacterium]|nr:hypothetical protein [Pseudomonadota bacterium]
MTPTQPDDTSQEPKRADQRRHVFDNPENVKKLRRVLYAACALVVLSDPFLRQHAEHPSEVFAHAQHPWEWVFAFYAAYGFAAYVLIVLGAKVLRRAVMRDERYYGPAEE